MVRNEYLHHLPWFGVNIFTITQGWSEYLHHHPWCGMNIFTIFRGVE
jgi:hypothetical protein